MYPLDKIKRSIVKEINSILGEELINLELFSYPPNKEMGDLSLPMFQVAKSQAKNPADISKDLMAKITEKKAELGLDTVSSAGPYLNFKINQQFLAKNTLSLIEEKKDTYGKNQTGEERRVMVEYTNANTHKQYHVGHVRNLCFGDTVSNILESNGYKVFKVSYINDFGIHTAKTLWGLNEFFKDVQIPQNKGAFLGEVYVKSSLEAKENKLAKGMIEGIMKKIESREGEEYKKWQETRQWTIDQFDGIYKKMRINLEHIFYESEYIDEGRKIVDELFEKGLLRKSEGAVIADLEKYNLGVQVVLRSDGTATYIVADLALAKAKFESYKLDTSVYVTDNRQELHFKQMFKLLELMGYKQKLVHLTHDFVKLPGGMIASRTGNVVTFDELFKTLFERVQLETKKRHEDWSEKQIDKVALELTIATIKFEMLKMGSDQVITFDINKALDFRGYTSAYLLYTYARGCSIKKKAGTIKKEEALYENLVEEKEHELLLKMAKFPEIVKRAGEKYDPSEIAKYLFELAQIFNDYYHSVNIIKGDKKFLSARINLIERNNQVIKNGLKLLGVEVLEEM